ncbi:hypothetical protein M8494_04400 [Serratia ureilytica]
MPNSRNDDAAADSSMYLMAASQRALLAVGVAHRAEQRQRDQLDTDEQRSQMVGARQQDAAHGGVSTSR